MSEFEFDPHQSIVICHAEIVGPRMELSLKMAIDTGATYTIIPIEAAIAIGCNPLRSQRKIEITTASSIEYTPIVVIPKFRVFGRELKNMKAICHDLPPQSPVEGLIGLDLLKKIKAIIDFSKNTIKISK